MMRLPAKLVLLGVMSMVAVGCGLGGGDTTAQQQESPVTGRVAVIDLDRIADKLNRDEAMAESMKSAAASLQEQLKSLQASYQSAFEQAVQQVSHEESAESPDRQQVALLGRQLNTKLNDAKRKAQVQLTNHRQKLIAEFRAEVKPVAEQVARNRGLDVVITKNDTVVFAFASAVDITDEVIKAMQAKAPAKTAAAPAAQTETK